MGYDKFKPLGLGSMGSFIHEKETVHLADRTGRWCVRCGRLICGQAAEPWAEGTAVVLIGIDERGAWKTLKKPTCQDRGIG